MAATTPSHTPESGHAPLRSPDFALVDLVDALVAAVDTRRFREVDQLRFALEPFGGAALFDAELRLNGSASTDEWCICGGKEF
ncbi:MAG: hypothetical protein AAGA65_19780 [Actinomycetota bacterium]